MSYACHADTSHNIENIVKCTPLPASVELLPSYSARDHRSEHMFPTHALAWLESRQNKDKHDKVHALFRQLQLVVCNVACERVAAGQRVEGAALHTWVRLPS